jgi:hypothetical protein
VTSSDNDSEVANIDVVSSSDDTVVSSGDEVLPCDDEVMTFEKAVSLPLCQGLVSFGIRVIPCDDEAAVSNDGVAVSSSDTVVPGSCEDELISVDDASIPCGVDVASKSSDENGAVISCDDEPASCAGALLRKCKPGFPKPAGVGLLVRKPPEIVLPPFDLGP